MQLRIYFVAQRRLDPLDHSRGSTSASGLRTPVEGPDGNLYVTTDARPGGDEILRVQPT